MSKKSPPDHPNSGSTGVNFVEILLVHTGKGERGTNGDVGKDDEEDW